MSLVIALAGKREIVVAGDTLLRTGDEDGFYRSRVPFPKIFCQNAESHFVVGHAGSSSSRHYLKDESSLDKASFRETVESYKTAIDEQYTMNRVPSQFVIAGFEKGQPQIYHCVCDDFKTQLAQADLGRLAIGIGGHGAMYLIHRYHENEMSLDQLLLLGCFGLQEAIRFDGRVANPLQVAVVQPDKRPKFLSEDAIDAINARCENIHTAIQNLFLQGPK